MANFVGVVQHKKPGEESWTATGAKEQALKDFRRWHPKVRAIIEAADTLNRWPLFDRPQLSKWHEGRAVLLGDACHPMLPFLAQGAAMAIEDAWALGACLSAEPARPFTRPAPVCGCPTRRSVCWPPVPLSVLPSVSCCRS